MKFSIVAEFGIIEEDCKGTNRPTACFSVVEISVNQYCNAGLFQIHEGLRSHPFFIVSDVTLQFGEVRTCVLIV